MDDCYGVSSPTGYRPVGETALAGCRGVVTSHRATAMSKLRSFMMSMICIDDEFQQQCPYWTLLRNGALTCATEESPLSLWAALKALANSDSSCTVYVPKYLSRHVASPQMHVSPLKTPITVQLLQPLDGTVGGFFPWCGPVT